MDPDETLRRIRTEVGEIRSAAGDEPDEPYTQEQLQNQAIAAVELADAVHALDEWMTGGGFAPADWRRNDAS